MNGTKRRVSKDHLVRFIRPTYERGAGGLQVGSSVTLEARGVRRRGTMTIALPSGRSSCTKMTEGVARATREHRGERWCGFVEEGREPSRVAEGKQHAIDHAIALLQLKTSHQGLTVARGRLGLDTKSPVRTSDQAIPSASVAGDREWHLQIPPERWMQQQSEVRQDRRLAGIA